MKIFRISQEHKNPDDMTEDEFVQYHKTKSLPPVKDRGGSFRWYHKGNYDILLEAKRFGNLDIEFRKSSSKDFGGSKVVAFNGEIAVGTAQEYDNLRSTVSMDGVWVDPRYQKLGIGTYLLHLFRRQFANDRQIGDMTELGEKMVRRYHRKLKSGEFK